MHRSIQKLQSLCNPYSNNRSNIFSSWLVICKRGSPYAPLCNSTAPQYANQLHLNMQISCTSICKSILHPNMQINRTSIAPPHLHLLLTAPRTFLHQNRGAWSPHYYYWWNINISRRLPTWLRPRPNLQLVPPPSLLLSCNSNSVLACYVLRHVALICKETRSVSPVFFALS